MYNPAIIQHKQWHQQQEQHILGLQEQPQDKQQYRNSSTGTAVQEQQYRNSTRTQAHERIQARMMRTHVCARGMAWNCLYIHIGTSARNFCCKERRLQVLNMLFTGVHTLVTNHI